MTSLVPDSPAGFTPPHILANLPPETPVLLALSGGADSRALLHMLVHSCGKYGAPLYAAHVDHMIRPDEHERDREFCRHLAGEYGIRIFILEEDVPALAAERHTSLELEARHVRYDFFESLMRENGIPLLATAHNADDNLETMIYNLARGTGLRGICGIPPVRIFGNGFIVRPILGIEKNEIIGYCKSNNLEFVTDSTNADEEYSRNRIRHKIIPELKKVNGAAAKNALRLSETLSRDRDFIESSARGLLDRASRFGGLSIETLNSAPPTITSHALSIAFNEISGGGDNSAEAVHIDALLALCKNGREGSSVSMPGSLRGEISNGLLVFVKDEKTVEPVPSPYETTLGNGENEINGTYVISISNEPRDDTDTFAAVAALSVSGRLYARNRRTGDRILSGGMHKSVKKLMCDKKVRRDIRDTLPVVCDDLGILWIPFVGTRDGTKMQKNNEATYINLTFCKQ